LPGVRVIPADIEKTDLGFDAFERDALCDRVTSIVHAAALTRFDAPLEAARAVNVDGTRNVLAFAERCRRLDRVTVLSTIYVAGKRTGIIRESELDHDCGFVNAYEQSKWEAEQLTREAMRRLPISVLRLSTVAGAHDTGVVGKPGAVHHAMRFLYNSLLPMMPGTEHSVVDLISTEYAIAAIRWLSGDGFAPGRTFQVCAAGDAPRQSDLFDLVIDAFMRYRPAWRRRAIAKPAIVELRTFELFRDSVDAVADPALRASVAVLAPFAPQLAYPKMFEDSACRAALDAAGISRPPIGETLDAVIRYLVETNWTPPWPA
jgi:nucleoside-diphosphate-sugar epimerase